MGRHRAGENHGTQRQQSPEMKSPPSGGSDQTQPTSRRWVSCVPCVPCVPWVPWVPWPSPVFPGAAMLPRRRHCGAALPDYIGMAPAHAEVRLHGGASLDHGTRDDNCQKVSPAVELNIGVAGHGLCDVVNVQTFRRAPASDRLGAGPRSVAMPLAIHRQGTGRHGMPLAAAGTPNVDGLRRSGGLQIGDGNRKTTLTVRTRDRKIRHHTPHFTVLARPPSKTLDVLSACHL